MNKSGLASSALKHVQFDSMVTQETLFAVTAQGCIYGFLIEEPQDTPLYLLIIDKTSGDIIASYASEGGAKFGRDGQNFAMHYLPAGCDVALSTSRSSFVAPTAGSTLHVWFQTTGK